MKWRSNCVSSSTKAVGATAANEPGCCLRFRGQRVPMILFYFRTEANTILLQMHEKNCCATSPLPDRHSADRPGSRKAFKITYRLAIYQGTYRRMKFGRNLIDHKCHPSLVKAARASHPGCCQKTSNRHGLDTGTSPSNFTKNRQQSSRFRRPLYRSSQGTLAKAGRGTPGRRC